MVPSNGFGLSTVMKRDLPVDAPRVLASKRMKSSAVGVGVGGGTGVLGCLCADRSFTCCCNRCSVSMMSDGVGFGRSLVSEFSSLSDMILFADTVR